VWLKRNQTISSLKVLYLYDTRNLRRQLLQTFSKGRSKTFEAVRSIAVLHPPKKSICFEELPSENFDLSRTSTFRKIRCISRAFTFRSSSTCLGYFLSKHSINQGILRWIYNQRGFWAIFVAAEIHAGSTYLANLDSSLKLLAGIRRHPKCIPERCRSPCRWIREHSCSPVQNNKIRIGPRQDKGTEKLGEGRTTFQTIIE